VATVSKALS